MLKHTTSSEKAAHPIPQEASIGTTNTRMERYRAENLLIGLVALRCSGLA